MANIDTTKEHVEIAKIHLALLVNADIPTLLAEIEMLQSKLDELSISHEILVEHHRHHHVDK